jgi:hypothetical protein
MARRKPITSEVAATMAQAPALHERPAPTLQARADRTLRFAAVIFAAGFVVHNADHVRRGVDAITAQVFAGGVVVSVAAVVALALIAMRHSAAPFVAAVVGTATTVAVTASHLLPHWGVFSDAFPGARVDGLSWFAVLFEIAGAVVLAAAGLNALRRRD